MTTPYRPPLEIHVTWALGSAPTPLVLGIADFLHRALGRWVPPPELDEAPTGAGLPVLLGTPSSSLGPSAATPTERLVVGILDSVAYMQRDRDSALESFLQGPDGFVVMLDPRFAERFRSVPHTRKLTVSSHELAQATRAVLDKLVVALHRRLCEAERVTLFVHDRDHDTMRSGLSDRISNRSLSTWFHADDDVTVPRMRDAKAGLLVDIRRDGFTHTTRDAVVIDAKELALPIVGVQTMSSGVAREGAYRGNGPVVVVDPRAPADFDRLLDKCLTTWLAHCYFLEDAKRLRSAAGLPADTRIVSRPPELVDFANGMLQGGTSVVLYPDPPLPSIEANIIQRQFANVRLVTPSTIHGQILAHAPRPPLDGMRIALSLSAAPDLPDLIPPQHEGSPVATWQGGRHPRGLTERHYREAVEYLSLCLVRAGAELAYGGHLNPGHTLALSRHVRDHGHVQSSFTERFYVYRTDATAAGTTDVQASFRDFPPHGIPATGSVKAALDYTAMRSMMADECHARVVLGGKQTPIARTAGVPTNDPSAHSGRYPGLVEEAWLTLRGPRGRRPLYVLGGFGGAAEDVGRALRGTKPDVSKHDAIPGFAEFRSEVDRLRGEGAMSDAALWDGFVVEGGLLGPHGRDAQAMCDNGLTVADNDRLFASSSVAEMVGLVMRGLVRVARNDTNAPLALMPYHGSIANSPPVDVFVVPVVADLPMGGADHALDEATDGRLTFERERLGPDCFKVPGHIEIIPINGGRLAGHWIALVAMGPHAAIDTDPRATARELGRAVGMKATELGWVSLATVVMGGNLTRTPDIAKRLGEFVTGLRYARGLSLRNVVVCEHNPDKYNTIVSTCMTLADASEGAIKASALPPDPIPPRSAKLATVLIVTRDKDRLSVRLVPPRADCLAFVHTIAIEPWLDRQLDAPLPSLAYERERLLSNLGALVLSEHTRQQLAHWVQHPVRIQHDEATAALPFERLLDSSAGHVYALAAGVTRVLQVSRAARAPRVRGRNQGRLRILLVIDPTDDLTAAREESISLEPDLKLRGAEVIRLVGSAATHDAVLAVLARDRIDVMYYAGHSGPRGLSLAGGTNMTGPDFERLNEHVPSLFVLNSCSSAVIGAPATGTPDTGDTALASAVLRSGANCFIGTGWQIDDRAAARFGRRFLRNLTAPASVGEALTRTLAAMRNEDFDDDYWFYYRLFGDDQLSFH